MERREALKRVSYLMGGAISIPTIAALMQGCETPKEEGATWTPQFLTQLQAELVTEVSELIMPTTDTPGAKDAGVPQFIDLMLKDCYKPEDQKVFTSGLDQLAQGGFLDLEKAQQIERLKSLESEAMSAREGGSREASFWFMMKELTLFGYFTSEIGATQALSYVPVPGAYIGCVPYEEGQKAWATR